MEMADTTIQDAAEQQEPLIPELRIFKGLIAETVKSPESRSLELAPSPPQWVDLKVKLLNEPGLDIQTRSEDPDSLQGRSSLGIENGPTGAEQSYLKEGNVPTGDNESDALDREDLKHETINQVILDQSSASLERSLDTVRDLSTPTKLPLDHGEITSYGVQRFLESEQNIAQGKRPPLKAANASDPSLTMQEQELHSKQQIKKMRRAPKIRSAKLDASQKVDLTPAPGADKYWTYDEYAKAYYHIDSDTQSTFWYEDSSEDSED
jgi:hypothetical protein